ncbi:ANTAR domain-containing response regulator [Caballeronia sp. 15715]|uniref:ANTAR domain-containing response regulator n=1 Tax=Caballeronia sp. 15715 TaxID=3391030 RepID=UPI0039E6E470
MKKTTLSLRGKRICALYCESKDQVNLEQQLRRQGAEVDFFNFFPEPLTLIAFDFIVFDGDHASLQNHGKELPWPDVPRIAILGTETPSRLQWIIEQDVAGYMRKPIRYDGVLSACVLAENSHVARRYLQTRVGQLEERVKARRFVISAQLQLMKERQINEQDAYAALRTLAMKRHISLEEISIDLLSHVDKNGCNSGASHDHDNISLSTQAGSGTTAKPGT